MLSPTTLNAVSIHSHQSAQPHCMDCCQQLGTALPMQEEIMGGRALLRPVKPAVHQRPAAFEDGVEARVRQGIARFRVIDDTMGTTAHSGMSMSP